MIIEKSEEHRTVGSERLVKRKSGPRSPRTNGGSSYGDDYGYVLINCFNSTFNSYAINFDVIYDGVTLIHRINMNNFDCLGCLIKFFRN